MVTSQEKIVIYVKVISMRLPVIVRYMGWL